MADESSLLTLLHLIRACRGKEEKLSPGSGGGTRQAGRRAQGSPDLMSRVMTIMYSSKSSDSSFLRSLALYTEAEDSGSHGQGGPRGTRPAGAPGRRGPLQQIRDTCGIPASLQSLPRPVTHAATYGHAAAVPHGCTHSRAHNSATCNSSYTRGQLLLSDVTVSHSHSPSQRARTHTHTRMRAHTPTHARTHSSHPQPQPEARPHAAPATHTVTHTSVTTPAIPRDHSHNRSHTR